MARRKTRHRKVVWIGTRKSVKQKRRRERRISLGAGAARKWWRSRKAQKMTGRGRHWVSQKIRKIVREGKSVKQAVAIALNMARKKGFKVPRKKARR